MESSQKIKINMKELKKSLFPVFEDQFQLPRSRGGGAY